MFGPAPYFAYPSRHEQLGAELDSWKGTKFSRSIGGKAKKGVAADCVSFVGAVLVNLGAIKPIDWPPYVVFGGGAKMFELIMTCIDRIPNMRRIWTPSDGALPHLLPGDIFLRSVGDDYHHMAIFAGGKALWHMREVRGLRVANLHDPRVTEDLKAIYRTYEPTN